MHHSKLIRGMTASFVALTAAGTARAQEVLGDLEIVGAPIDRGIGFQPAATELARELFWLCIGHHHYHLVVRDRVAGLCLLCVPRAAQQDACDVHP